MGGSRWETPVAISLTKTYFSYCIFMVIYSFWISRVASLGNGATLFYPAPRLRSNLDSIHYAKRWVHSCKIEVKHFLASTAFLYAAKLFRSTH